MYRKLFSGVCFLLVTVVFNGYVLAEFVGPAKASQNFSFKYEMDVLPTTQDLDNNGVADWSISSAPPAGSISVSNGVMTVIDGAGGIWVGGGGANQVWQANFPSGSNFTVECAVKVLSTVDDSTGVNGVFQMFASTGHYSDLRIGGNFVNLKNSRLSSADNMDNFHVFRLARQGSLYYVWRDGVLIGDGLSLDGGSVSAFFGDGSGAINGSSAVDYVRLEVGAYAPAPIPEPGMISMVVMGAISLIVYAWRKRA